MSRHTSSLCYLLLAFLLTVVIAGCGGNSNTTASSNPPGSTGSGSGGGSGSGSGSGSGGGSGSGSGGNGGGSGGGSTPSTQILVVSESKGLNTPGALGGFKIDPNSGQLSGVSGSPFPLADSPTFTAVDPAGVFLFAAHESTNSFGTTVYKIDPSSGAISSASENPGVDGLMLVHPTGKFLYVADASHFSSTVSAFTISSSGQLAAVAGSPFSTGSMVPDSITIDPAGRFLYVGSSSSNSIAGFSIDASTGALTLLPGMPQVVRAAPPEIGKTTPTVDVKFDRAGGKFLFLADGANQLLNTYAVDQGTGLVTKLTSVPEKIVEEHMVVTPDNKFVYTSSQGGQPQIEGFAIAASTGMLTPIPGSPFAVPAGTDTFFTVPSLGVDNTGKFLYAGANTGELTGFTIDPNTGKLTQIGTPVNTGAFPNSLSIAK